MRIHALCVIKNEADIVAQGLAAALAWADSIYILDNGSTDGTWERIHELAREHPAIVPWRQQVEPFSDGLRARIFHAFADRANAGDWWARLDPDEFYVDDPRAFLARVPTTDHCVWYASLSYYFSTEEARRYREDPLQFADDVPITDKCRHYFNHWSEIRFVRHEAMEPWIKGGWPEDLTRRARSYHKRILCRHFPYRSPKQIELRLATRSASAVSGTVFNHEALRNWSATVDPRAIRRHRWQDVRYVKDPTKLECRWESRVIDASGLVFDAHDGNFSVNEDLMPPIPGVPRPLSMRLRHNRITRQLKGVMNLLRP